MKIHSAVRNVPQEFKIRSLPSGHYYYYPSNKTMRSERSQTQHIYDFLWQYLTPCLWNYINVRSRDKARLYLDLNNYSRYSTWEMQIYKYPYQVGIRWETRETGPVEHSWGVAGSNIKTFCLTIRLQYCISNLSFIKPRDLPVQSIAWYYLVRARPIFVFLSYNSHLDMFDPVSRWQPGEEGDAPGQESPGGPVAQSVEGAEGELGLSDPGTDCVAVVNDRNTLHQYCTRLNVNS